MRILRLWAHPSRLARARTFRMTARLRCLRDVYHGCNVTPSLSLTLLIGLQIQQQETPGESVMIYELRTTP